MSDLREQLITGKVPCPRCGAAGKNMSGSNLSRIPNYAAYECGSTSTGRAQVISGDPTLDCDVGHYRRKAEHLQAIVDKLDTTADGVPIVPGMELHYLKIRTGVGFQGSSVTIEIEPRKSPPPQQWTWYFSTHAEAVAASATDG